MDRKQKIKNTVTPVVIITIAVVVFMGFVKSKPKVDSLAVDEKVWGVDVIEVKPEKLSPQITLYGKVETPRHSQLTAAIAADVRQVFVRNGDDVEKGQILIELDNSDNTLLFKQREAELTEIKALIKSENARYDNDKKALQHEKQLLDLASQEYDRALSLERSKLSTRSRIDEANQVVLKQRLAVEARELSVSDHQARLAQLTARAQKSKAMLDQVQLDIDRGKITAPYASKITSVKVAEGDRARIGNVLLELYDYTALEVRAQIPIQYLNPVQFALSQPNKLQAHTFFNDNKISLQLDRLAGEISQGSGGQDSFFSIASKQVDLPLGRTLEIKLALPPVENAIAVPRSAVYGSNRIYRYDNGRMVGHVVERLGDYHSDDANKRYLLIKDERLKGGQQIITTQLPNAIDGLKVKILTPVM